MWDYLKRHEAFVSGVLAGEHGELSLEELKAFHERQIGVLQHERLIHLIVTLFFAALWLLSLGYVAIQPGWVGLALFALLLALVAGYVVHYYRLENGVQRLYHLTNRIDQALGLVAAQYDGSDEEEKTR